MFVVFVVFVCLCVSGRTSGLRLHIYKAFFVFVFFVLFFWFFGSVF